MGRTPKLHQGKLAAVGRKSREKLRRRTDPEYGERVKAAQAESRGKQVPPTPAGYTRAAETRGHAGIVEALISRHNQRWSNVRHNLTPLSEPIAESLHVIYPLDAFLWRMGVRFTEPPSDPAGGWLGQLRWGLDSACQVSRMLLASNPLGAAAVARTQIERWSYNRIVSNGIEQEDGVSTSEHYTTIWMPEGPKVPAGTVWTSLSELLHGRGPLLDSARWESIDLADPQRIGASREIFLHSLTATELSLRQVLLGVVSLTRNLGSVANSYHPLLEMPLSLPSEVRMGDSPTAVWPLNLEMLSSMGEAVARYGAAHLSDVEKLASGQKTRELVYSARSLEAFASRRGRAASTAIRAFEAERQHLGDRFAPKDLAQRELAYIWLNETAAILASWIDGPVSDALTVASSALRAAFWLWLEDDDRSMVLARTVVDQTARLRVWRVKPEKAENIEARGSRTSTRDWIDTAGWRRLSILNRSLGEFSHTSLPATLANARAALSAIQNQDDAHAEHTARGGTLNEIAYAFGSEISYLTRAYHPSLAAAFESVLPYAGVDGTEARVEQWLQRCWMHRGLTLRAN